MIDSVDVDEGQLLANHLQSQLQIDVLRANRTDEDQKYGNSHLFLQPIILVDSALKVVEWCFGFAQL